MCKSRLEEPATRVDPALGLKRIQDAHSMQQSVKVCHRHQSAHQPWASMIIMRQCYM